MKIKMNKLQIVSMIICILSVVIYKGYNYYDSKQTDPYGPVLELSSYEITVSIKDGEEALLEGVTASDVKDGDVSDSIVIESVSKFLNNTKTVTYAAFDSDRNVGKVTRTVIYEDYIPPTFSSENGFRFPLGASNLLDGLTAKDCIDGDVTSQIRVSAAYYVDTEKAGLYDFQYQVTNNSGDVEYLPVTVEIYDTADMQLVPQIALKEYVVYTSVGKKIDPKKYLDHVTIGGGQYEFGSSSTYSSLTPTMGGTLTKGQISVDDSKVNYEEPGTYEVTYSMKVDDEHIGTNRLVVVVR